MESIKQINIKNHTNHFFNDMIRMKGLNPDLLKIDKRSFKNTIYYIGYITIKDTDYVNIHSVNPLYFVNPIDKADGYIEESNENKYLTQVSNDRNKEVSIKYTELWNKFKNLTEKINGKPREYEKNLRKIKFSSNDNLPLGKILSLHKMTIDVRSVFQKDNKYYPQVFLDECLYEV